MHQAIRRHPIVTYAISVGLMGASMSLLQPITSTSAQNLTGPISQDTSVTGTQERHIPNRAGGLRYQTRSSEMKNADTSTPKSHRLIRRPQNLQAVPSNL